MIKTRFVCLLILISLLFLAACADEAAPTNLPAVTNASSTPTSGVGSGIAAQPAPNGQPLPTPIPPGPDTRKILTIWTSGWRGNTNLEKFLNDQIDSYRTRFRNLTVDWQDFSKSELLKNYQEVATAKSSPLPDLVLLEAGDLYQFGAAGYLADLGANTLKDDYSTAPYEALQIGSAQYGLPWLASTPVTIINKKLWEKSKLDPAKPPKTFAELDPMLPLMAKNTDSDVRACWFKPDPLVDFMMEDVTLYKVSGDGQANQTNFPTDDMVNKWLSYQDKRRQDKQFFDADGLTKDYTAALGKYAADQLVIVLDGAPLLAGLKTANAELYKNTLVVPHVTGKAGVLPLYTQGWAISKTSGQVDEALAFLKFINTTENQLTIAKSDGLLIPTLKKALADPYVTSQDEPISQARSIMAATLDRTRVAARLLPARLLPTDREKLITALNTAQTIIWTKTTPPREALNEAAKIWNEVFAK